MAADELAVSLSLLEKTLNKIDIVHGFNGYCCTRNSPSVCLLPVESVLSGSATGSGGLHFLSGVMDQPN